VNASVIKYPVVKPYLPEKDKYTSQVSEIFSRNWLTNSGPLVQALEMRLAEYLGVEHLLLVANGTLALQVAYAALDVKGEVLTTPFSFAATASSLCWQGIKPHFIDIDADSLNFDVSAVTPEHAESASAILAVHVFGNPCDVDKIAQVSQQYNLKVIYDAAHAFASNFEGKSVLNYGDASTLSLHATKLFHSVEGGAIVFKNQVDYVKAKQLINFGFDSASYPQYVGINAKMSEFHAAMGLAVLDDIDYVTCQRKALINHYHMQLENVLQLQIWHEQGARNGAYMPVIFESEQQLIAVIGLLGDAGIQSRRYFYPSLSQVPAYGMQGKTDIANDISARILCLPMYTDLQLTDVDVICTKLKHALSVFEQSL
jgi:dTDP-4-amino-4,6-dideoxygalactose transaminase